MEVSRLLFEKGTKEMKLNIRPLPHNLDSGDKIPGPLIWPESHMSFSFPDLAESFSIKVDGDIYSFWDWCYGPLDEKTIKEKNDYLEQRTTTNNPPQ